MDGAEIPSSPTRPTLRARLPRGLTGTALLALALIALPLLGGDFLAYQIGLYLLYGVAAQGVALCWGQLGFLPLGQALFFGLGAYGGGALLKQAQLDPLWWFALPLACLLPALLAWLLARLVFARSHRSGPYFSLTTLALSVLAALAANRFSGLTGGFNGMTDIPSLPGLERYSNLYWAVAALALLSTAALTALLRLPIGTLWRAVREDENRLQFFGYATDRMKATAFALAALCASCAGLLFSAHQGIVTPQTLGFLLSTELVIWCAVGGKSSPFGALLGAVLVGYGSAELRDHFAYWEVLVALVFIAVVRFLPEGVWGWLGNVAARLTPRATSVPLTAPAPPLRHRAGNTPVDLTFEQVQCSASGVAILNGLSLRLNGPGIRCLIGPNGAGKTSSFNALTGRLPAQAGQMRWNGRAVGGCAAWQIARLGIGRKFQIPSVWGALSVRDNLRVALWAQRLQGADVLRSAAFQWQTPLLQSLLARFPTLQASLDLPAQQLAQGDRQALELVMVALPEPRLLLLDEPCAGLSPPETQRMMAAIQALAAQLQAGVWVIEHDMQAVQNIAAHVHVMHQGRLLAEGSLTEVQANAAVRAVYAGGQK